MKRIILFTLASALAVSASAQSWQDALLFSENEYGGTARSVAMGNALTAVGGDLGSLGLNPAGSAVAGYSQMTLTPALSFSVARATSDNPELGYGDNVRTLYTRLKMPNLGFVANINTGRRHGLKRVSFGFLYNSTADYTGRMYATGINSSNSFSGAVASSAQGYPEDALSGANTKYGWWNLDDYSESYGLSWRDMVAYRSGIFGTVNGRYLGLTDWDKDGKNSGVLAPLFQKFGFQTKGYKNDMIINVGFNHSDEFYWGINVGITLMSYGQSEYWSEAPANINEFPAIPFDSNPNARFQYLEMKRIFDAKGTGAYLKVGALWRPADTGLRLGAAFQTPTVMNLDTRSAWYGKADVTGVSLPSAQSPEWDDAYTLITPSRFNAGVAYTFGSVALASVDYEVVNYRHNRFRSRSESGIYYPNSYFDNANADIRDVLGFSHSLRAGLEVNVLPGVAVRAGYSFTTGAQHNILKWEYNPEDGLDHLMVYALTPEERAALVKHTVSAGLGFTSGAFFTDITFRYRSMPRQSFVTYTYYDYSGTDYTNKYESTDPSYAVPEVIATYNRFDAILTLGMRF